MIKLFIILILIMNSEIKTENSLLLNINDPEVSTLKFATASAVRFFGSANNIDSLILSNYSGRPLKALQFKIAIGKNLVFKSMVKGSILSSSGFLLDYQFHKDIRVPGGSVSDAVYVVLLGLENNSLQPGNLCYLLSIEYDVNSESADTATGFHLYDVKGAAAETFTDANISSGEDKIIYLIPKPIEEEGIISLFQNYPNPFNPETTISFTIPEDDHVILSIYNSIGERVITLLDEYISSGNYTVTFNADGFSSGIYFYRLKTKEFTRVRKMILLE